MATKSKKSARKPATSKRVVKAAAAKSAVKKSSIKAATKSDIVVGPATYRTGDKVRVLDHKTTKPKGGVLRIQKPEKGEATPGKGWFLAGDAWSHHTGLIPA